ncbi:MAG: hypothetical protein K2M64_02435 [Clostridia bacterium]|nr:hypothetical protein [Clostridia bacterium]
MNLFNILADSLLTVKEALLVGAIFVLFLALIIANAMVIVYYNKTRERKLCTHQLQNKRNELLNQLQQLMGGEQTSSDYDEDTEDAEEMLVVRSKEDYDVEPPVEAQNNLNVVAQEDVDETMDAEILAVADMSDYARQKLNLAGSEFDSKRYYVRCSYSFEAKLRNSSDEIKERFVELINEINLYKVKMQCSFNQIRVYKGRTTLAFIMFVGKALCIAYALNPADYADTKYSGIDKSNTKRFANTPMLLKLTSNRKVQYAKYLLLQLADAHTVVMQDNPQVFSGDLSAKTNAELYHDDKVRLTILGEVPQGVTTGYADNDADVIADEDEDDNAELAEDAVRYNRSFIARIIQADDELKARYSEIKNHILSYQNVFNKITWKREAFYADKRACIATFAIRGKTLCLFLAEDPSKFDGTKYKVESISSRPNAKMPTMCRIKSDRSTKFAKEMIDIVFAEKGIAENLEYKPTNFRPAYQSTDNLVKKGYIHVNF